MNNFKTGSTVKSLVNAQGLTKGDIYEVAAIETKYTFAGGYSTYCLRDSAGKMYIVGNAHLVLGAP